jgi:hypothetical protein
MATLRISREDAIKKLYHHKKEGNGRIISVVFRKRTTGELRTMNCRFKVKKFLRGGSRLYDFKAKRLMLVCDVNLVAIPGSPYRTINLDAIKTMCIDGNRYIVRQ